MAIPHVSEWGKEDRVGIKEIIKLYSEELFSEDWDIVLREQRVWDYRKKRFISISLWKPVNIKLRFCSVENGERQGPGFEAGTDVVGVTLLGRVVI